MKRPRGRMRNEGVTKRDRVRDGGRVVTRERGRERQRKISRMMRREDRVACNVYKT